MRLSLLCITGSFQYLHLCTVQTLNAEASLIARPRVDAFSDQFSKAQSVSFFSLSGMVSLIYMNCSIPHLDWYLVFSCVYILSLCAH
jgi:hypothetical protein